VLLSRRPFRSQILPLGPMKRIVLAELRPDPVAPPLHVAVVLLSTYLLRLSSFVGLRISDSPFP
jgi:hypothetical protein